MAEASHRGIEAASRRPWLTIIVACGAVLFLGGLAGMLAAAWGYALFVASGLLLFSGTVVFAVFVLTRVGKTSTMQRGFVLLFLGGAGAYVLSLSALAGYYMHEALGGRIEWHWMVFGPLVVAALVVLDYGLYRKLVKNNLPTWRRYRKYIGREQSDPAAMRRSLVDEVILHRSLFRISRVRWLRHALIFWGFIAMFVTELFAVVLRDGFPAFGWRDIWREPGHPLRLAFAWVYDVTGLMIVLGCLLALAWRAAVNASPDRKYSDTPTTLFLLFVAVTGFIIEGLHIVPMLNGPAYSVTPIGLGIARLMAHGGLARVELYQPLWVVHVIAACLFIAYVPVMRLIHSCATPFGRLANSQKAMLAAKKRGVLGGMLSSPRSPSATDAAPLMAVAEQSSYRGGSENAP
jgi:MFS family permease